jgi:hypothetical protein
MSGGLLRIRERDSRFYQRVAERFVLKAEPAGDGSVWVAGYALDRSFRGACRLAAIIDSGASSAVVIVPGQVRRLLPATNGVWLATEEP